MTIRARLLANLGLRAHVHEVHDMLCRWLRDTGQPLLAEVTELHGPKFNGDGPPWLECAGCDAAGAELEPTSFPCKTYRLVANRLGLRIVYATGGHLLGLEADAESDTLSDLLKFVARQMARCEQRGMPPGKARTLAWQIAAASLRTPITAVAVAATWRMLGEDRAILEHTTGVELPTTHHPPKTETPDNGNPAGFDHPTPRKAAP